MKKKIIMIVFAALVLIVSAGGYAVYGANKDKKAEESVNEAKASAAELYSQMEQKILKGEETGKFEKIDRDKILKVETLVSIAKADLEEASKRTSREFGGILKEIVAPKLADIQEYNKGAAIASYLYDRIDEAEKLAAENPLSPELLADLPQLKEDAAKENSKFKELKSPYSSLFADRYVDRVEKLEGVIKVFVTAEQAVQTAIDMSVDDQTVKPDFDQKVEDARGLINELTNKATIAELTQKLDLAVKAFGDADAKRKEEARKKAEEEAKNFIGPDGTVYKLAEGASFEPELSVAKKYGARLYYVPQSDVGAIVKDKAVILGMAVGSISTDLNNGALLADLLAARGFKITEKDIQNVIKSGSPFEKENEFFRVYLEGNQLLAETW